MLVADPAQQEEASAWLQGIQEAFQTLDISRIRECLDENVEVHYNLVPPMTGRERVCDFLAPRYAQLLDYRLAKKLRFVAGDMLGVEVNFEYTGAGSGQRVVGKGFEYLTRLAGKIRRWEYVSVTEQLPVPSKSPEVQ